MKPKEVRLLNSYTSVAQSRISMTGIETSAGPVDTQNDVLNDITDTMIPKTS